MTRYLGPEEQKTLLEIARDALEKAVRDEPLPKLDLEALPAALKDHGASFVTLTREGRLRGCIGTLDARQPLAVDVQEHAVAAALQDYRFPNVSLQELPELKIAVSALTPKTPLNYQSPDELIKKLRPDIDGVVLQDGYRKATFLPQVWEKVPQPEQFLSQLCLKMGAPADLWKQKPLKIHIYQVQEFHE